MGRSHSDAELAAAVQALTDPKRLQVAQDVVQRAAPQLQRVLNEALAEGGWFGPAHERQVREIAALDDAAQRETAVRTLVAEEMRLGMMVGVAVGYGLARELDDDASAHDDLPTTTQED